MIAAVSALSCVDFSRRPAAPHDGYLSSGSIVWGAGKPEVRDRAGAIVLAHDVGLRSPGYDRRARAEPAPRRVRET